jgi:putative SOS response-associated peptidase YedK
VAESSWSSTFCPDRPTPNFPAQLEHGAHRLLPVVRYDRTAEQRSPDLLRWSLIPCWAKDFKVGFANINAKAEGIDQAGVPSSVRAPSLPSSGRQLL